MVVKPTGEIIAEADEINVTAFDIDGIECPADKKVCFNSDLNKLFIKFYICKDRKIFPFF